MLETLIANNLFFALGLILAMFIVDYILYKFETNLYLRIGKSFYAYGSTDSDNEPKSRIDTNWIIYAGLVLVLLAYAWGRFLSISTKDFLILYGGFFFLLVLRTLPRINNILLYKGIESSGGIIGKLEFEDHAAYQISAIRHLTYVLLLLSLLLFFNSPLLWGAIGMQAFITWTNFNKSRRMKKLKAENDE